MTIRIKLMDAGYVTRVPGGTLHYPGGEDIAPAGWTTRLVLDPLGPAPHHNTCCDACGRTFACGERWATTADGRVYGGPTEAVCAACYERATRVPGEWRPVLLWAAGGAL